MKCDICDKTGGTVFFNGSQVSGNRMTTIASTSGAFTPAGFLIIQVSGQGMKIAYFNS